MSVTVLGLVGGAPEGDVAEAGRLEEKRDGDAGRKTTPGGREPYSASAEHLVGVAAGATPEPERGAGEPQLQGS